MAYRPLSWRNISVPSFADAGRLNESASNLFQGALNSFQGVLGDRERRYDDRVDLRSQEFIDSLKRQYSAPEALLEARRSGAIDQARRDAGGDLNPELTGFDAITSLIDTGYDRVQKDRERVQADRNAADAELKFRTRGARDQFGEHLAIGTKDSLALAAAMLQDPSVEFADRVARTTAYDNAQDELTNEARRLFEQDRSDEIAARTRRNSIEDRNYLLEGREREEKARKLTETVNQTLSDAIGTDNERVGGRILVDDTIESELNTGGITSEDIASGKVFTAPQLDYIEGVQQLVGNTETPKTTTDGLKELSKELRSKGANELQIAAAKEQYNNATYANTQASKADRADIENRIAAIANRSENKNNEYIVAELAGVPTSTAIANTVAEFNDTIQMQDQNSKQALLNALGQIMSEGYDYGIGTPVKVSPNLLKIALTGLDYDEWFGTGINLEEALDKLLKQGASSDKAFQAFKRFKTEVQETRNEWVDRMRLNGGDTRKLIENFDVEGGRKRLLATQTREQSLLSQAAYESAADRRFRKDQDRNRQTKELVEEFIGDATEKEEFLKRLRKSR